MLPFSVLPTPPRLAVRALNALLAREAWARERLARHSGKTARLAVGGFTAGLAVNTQGYSALDDGAVGHDVATNVEQAMLQQQHTRPGQERPTALGSATRQATGSGEG